MTSQHPELGYTVDEVAGLLWIGSKRVYQLISEGRLMAVGEYRRKITPESVERERERRRREGLLD